MQEIISNSKNELMVCSSTSFKLTLITKFQKKIPYKLWNGCSDEETQFFDSSKSGSVNIAFENGFNDIYDLFGTCSGLNYQKIVLLRNSSITMQESMISPNIRKTETEVIVKNILPETVIKIMSEVDKHKFLINGGEPEDLYIKISPENHPLESKIKNAYRAVGFNLLKYDPTQTKIGFFLSQASSVYQLGMFHYTQGVISDFLANNRLIRSGNPRRAINQNEVDLENNTHSNSI